MVVDFEVLGPDSEMQSLTLKLKQTILKVRRAPAHATAAGSAPAAPAAPASAVELLMWC